jgi:diaminohydroxyphosphoribosylaminopyrimidine deaminase/5-amino-6-(5-phosphoribosylamino)uracil reductase
MNPSQQDAEFLEMCYALAEKARGHTSPNPYVGALVVKAGEIVGWGYHAKAGRPHAEALALQRAGERARGATAYITLEPCTHWGRTAIVPMATAHSWPRSSARSWRVPSGI